MAMIRTLAPPNADLAVEPDGTVWKLKGSAWVRLGYRLPSGSALFQSATGRARRVRPAASPATLAE